MPAAAIAPGQKKVTITSKRQFTIPQKFFTELGFDREAVCTLGDGMLIIEPAKSENGGEFAEQILAGLIAEGYSGQDLLSEFKSRQSKVRPAVENCSKLQKMRLTGLLNTMPMRMFSEERSNGRSYNSPSRCKVSKKTQG